MKRPLALREIWLLVALLGLACWWWSRPLAYELTLALVDDRHAALESTAIQADFHFPLSKDLQSDAKKLEISKEGPQFQTIQGIEGIALGAQNGFLSIPAEIGAKEQGFTLSFWFLAKGVQEPESGLANLLWIGQVEQPGNPLFSLWWKSAGGMHLSALNLHKDIQKGQLFTDRFNRLTFRFDPAQQVYSTWLNGALLESPLSPETEPFLVPDRIQIAGGLAPKAGFNALYGGLSLWERALKDTEVKQLHRKLGGNTNRYNLQVIWNERLACFGLLLALNSALLWALGSLYFRPQWRALVLINNIGLVAFFLWG
ncbi:MAG: hypothetical protein RRB13_10305 [bacterium]|nr:hypothetical protein [bacterium]